MEEDSFEFFLIDYLPSLFSGLVGFSSLHAWATCDIIYSQKKKKVILSLFNEHKIHSLLKYIYIYIYNNKQQQ